MGFGGAMRNERSSYLLADTHANLEDRVKAAQVLADEFGSEVKCPLVVDMMSDEACVAFGAHPDRLLILQNDKVVYLGKAGPWNYSLDEVVDVLTKLQSPKKQ